MKSHKNDVLLKGQTGDLFVSTWMDPLTDIIT